MSALPSKADMCRDRDVRFGPIADIVGGHLLYLVVGYLFHPIDCLAVQSFLNGDMGHSTGWCLIFFPDKP